MPPERDISERLHTGIQRQMQPLRKMRQDMPCGGSLQGGILNGRKFEAGVIVPSSFCHHATAPFGLVGGEHNIYVGKLPQFVETAGNIRLSVGFDRERQRADGRSVHRTLRAGSLFRPCRSDQARPVIRSWNHRKYPIAKNLPFRSLLYNIDYKRTGENKQDFVVLITADSPINRGYAINQIKNWGLRPSDYEIEFRYISNPFKEKDQK